MSDVAHFIGHGKEGWMPIYLAARGLEHRLLLARRTGDDVSGSHYPDADAFIAPGVDVARVLDRHFSVRRVQAADVLVRQAMLRADEDFPQRPFMTHGFLSLFTHFSLTFHSLFTHFPLTFHSLSTHFPLTFHSL